MTETEKLLKLLEFQEIFRKSKYIQSLYEGEEKKAKALKIENDKLTIEIEELKINIEEMQKKVQEEEVKKEEILQKLKMLEESKEKIKVARQMRAWEKDVEKQKQEHSIIQAQIDYDNSKLEEMKKELERLQNAFSENEKSIEEALAFVKTVKEEHKDELTEIEAKEKEIKDEFDIQFIDYFEMLLKKTEGNALVEVEGEACSGCYTILPTSLQGELGEAVPVEEIQILQCPTCFRYLYHPAWVKTEKVNVREDK